MITAALMLLKKFWPYVLAALVVLAIYLWIHGLYDTIDNQGKQITQLTTANKTLTDNNDKLEASIKANNAALDKLATGAADTNKAFNALSGSVKQQASDLQKRLQQILAEKKPQTCDDTILYLIDAAKGYTK